jgi:hypothetical protein
MKQLRNWMSIFVFVVGLTLSLPVLAKAPLSQGPALKDLAKQQGDKYPTVAMHKSKLREDKAAGVIYLDTKQREERRVLIQNGLVYDYAGKPVLNSRSKHRNQINYVMDAAGNFYLFDEFTHPEIRHSSIFAGDPVAGAGNIKIEDGRIVYVDSDSGHYATEGVYENVLKELASHGVNMGDHTKKHEDTGEHTKKHENKGEHAKKHRSK